MKNKPQRHRGTEAWSYRNASVPLCLCGSALLMAWIAAPLAAQFRRGAVVETAAPAKPSVYVRDSAVAAEKLALAQRMERLKEWNKSADVYQEIVEKYADRVVPADDPGDASGTPTRYTSVTQKVQTL